MTALELMKENLKHLTAEELNDLRAHIEREQNLGDLALKAWERLPSGKLQAVKYVKDITGWGLKEAKEYCDELEVASKQGAKFERIFIQRGY